MSRHCRIPAVACILSAVLAGCGQPRLAPVHCKLRFEGKPAPAGSVTFAPKVEGDQFEAGRPATGTPDANGEFQLSTYKKDDGALIGPHIVIYTPPQNPEDSDPVRLAERLKLFRQFGRCRLPEGHTVEVKPGKNEFILELTR